MITIRDDVAKGVADLDEGRFTDLADEAELRTFRDHVKARGRERLAGSEVSWPA